MFRRKPSRDESEAPAIPPRLPWASRENLDLSLSEPPRPLTITTALTPEDIQDLRAASGGQGASLPSIIVVVAYLGLKTYLGDAVPDVLLYALFGGVFVVQTLLSKRLGRDHYATEGPLTLTLSANGVEVSAESWAGHVAWALVDNFAVQKESLVIQTATRPRLHGIPLSKVGPSDVAEIEVWRTYWKSRQRAAPGRTLLWLAGLGAAAVAALWWLERAGVPLPL